MEDDRDSSRDREAAGRDPAGFLASAIRPAAARGGGDEFEFDHSKLEAIYHALRTLFGPELHLELGMPSQRAALLSHLANEFSCIAMEEERDWFADGKRVVEQWKDRLAAREHYSFIAPLILDSTHLQGPESGLVRFDIGPFKIRSSWRTCRFELLPALPPDGGVPDLSLENNAGSNAMLWIHGSVSASLPTQAIALATQRIEEIVGGLLALELAEIAAHTGSASTMARRRLVELGEESDRVSEFSNLPPGWMEHVGEAGFPPLRWVEMALRIASRDPSKWKQGSHSAALSHLVEDESPDGAVVRRACRQYVEAVLEPDLGELFVRCVTCLESLLMPDEPDGGSVVADLLADRVVRLLGADNRNWGITKDAYQIRNRVVHGRSVDEGDSGPRDALARDALGLVRRVLEARIEKLTELSR